MVLPNALNMHYRAGSSLELLSSDFHLIKHKKKETTILVCNRCSDYARLCLEKLNFQEKLRALLKVGQETTRGDGAKLSFFCPRAPYLVPPIFTGTGSVLSF